MHRLLGACAEVYNAGLQHRRDAWRLARETVTKYDQYTALTGVREVRADVFAWGLAPLRGTLDRLDEAFAGFFRRVRDGDKAGFPRFKSRRRFNTVQWNQPQSWKVDVDRRLLYVQGVGEVRLSKSARSQLQRMVAMGGEPRTLRITRRRRGPGRNAGWVWSASVAFRGVEYPQQQPEDGDGSLVGVDLGVDVTVATSAGELLAVPDWAARAHHTVANLQRERARKHKGSRAWRRLNRRIARLRRKTANRIDDWARHIAVRLTDRYGTVAVEDLNLRAMTRSAKGTVRHPGTNVRQKAGLNRVLQGAALGKLADRIVVKAENAGRTVWLVDPAHTSRTCPACQTVDSASRPARDRFACTGCGHTAHADVNAAVNVAARAARAETERRRTSQYNSVSVAARQGGRTVGAGSVPRPHGRTSKRKR